jgi:hypothetical protein
MPAKAGIQKYLKTLDSRLRGNDAKGRFKTFYETINIDIAAKRHKKHKNQISWFVNSICYNEQKSKFRLFTNPSTLDVRCWMFDVRVYCSGHVKFHKRIMFKNT